MQRESPSCALPSPRCHGRSARRSSCACTPGSISKPPRSLSASLSARSSVPALRLSRIVVSTPAGSVTVTAGTPAAALITATPRYQRTAPVITSQVTGGTLTVAVSCPQVSHNCQVFLQLRVPIEVRVTAVTDLGNIHLAGLSGRRSGCRPVPATTSRQAPSLAARTSMCPDRRAPPCDQGDQRAGLSHRHWLARRRSDLGWTQ